MNNASFVYLCQKYNLHVRKKNSCIRPTILSSINDFYITNKCGLLNTTTIYFSKVERKINIKFDHLPMNRQTVQIVLTFSSDDCSFWDINANLPAIIRSQNTLGYCHYTMRVKWTSPTRNRIITTTKQKSTTGPCFFSGRNSYVTRSRNRGVTRVKKKSFFFFPWLPHAEALSRESSHKGYHKNLFPQNVSIFQFFNYYKFQFAQFLFTYFKTCSQSNSWLSCNCTLLTFRTNNNFYARGNLLYSGTSHRFSVKNLF